MRSNTRSVDRYYIRLGIGNRGIKDPNIKWINWFPLMKPARKVNEWVSEWVIQSVSLWWSSEITVIPTMYTFYLSYILSYYSVIMDLILGLDPLLLPNLKHLLYRNFRTTTGTTMSSLLTIPYGMLHRTLSNKHRCMFVSHGTKKKCRDSSGEISISLAAGLLTLNLLVGTSTR